MKTFIFLIIGITLFACGKDETIINNYYDTIYIDKVHKDTIHIADTVNVVVHDTITLTDSLWLINPTLTSFSILNANPDTIEVTGCALRNMHKLDSCFHIATIAPYEQSKNFFMSDTILELQYIMNKIYYNVDRPFILQKHAHNTIHINVF
jgi:hypothetical protein